MGRVALRIEEILADARRGGTVPRRDIRLAEFALHQSEEVVRASACEILLRSRCSETAMKRAVAVMEELCASASDEDLLVALLHGMLCLAQPMMEGRPGLRACAFRSAGSAYVGVRLMAVNVLLNLAMIGDMDAHRRVIALTNDDNCLVAINAQNAMRYLRGSR